MNRLLLIIIIGFFLGMRLNAQEKNYAFSLEEAVAFAIENNYMARTAKLDIDAAEKKKWETTTMGLPQIDANVDYGYWLKQSITPLPAEIVGGEKGEFIEIVLGTKQNVNATATLEQLIFDGSYLIGLQSAKTYLTISKLAKIKTDVKVREAVINAYGNVLVAEESISILEKNLEVLRKNLHETRAIYENGLAEEQDLEQQMLTLSSMEIQLNKAQRLYDISKKMFNYTLGLPIETPVELKDRLENLAIQSTDLQLVNEHLNLNDHIDFKIAENKVKSQELLVKYERSKSMPSLGAFINYSTFENNDNKVFFKHDEKWFTSSLFGVSLNIPVFSSLQRSARTQQAKIGLRQSEIARDETAQKLKLELEQAKNKYQFALDNFEVSKENVILAEKIANKEQIKFFEGLSTSFNLTNAQNQLYRKQQEYIQSILSLIQSKVELENALNKF